MVGHHARGAFCLFIGSRALFSAIALTSVLLAGRKSLRAEEPAAIAIAPLDLVVTENAGKDGEAAKLALEDSLQAYLSGLPNITLVERAKIDQAMKEQRLG